MHLKKWGPVLCNLVILLQPIYWLGLRIFMASIFWSSGLAKLKNMEVAKMVYESEFNLPEFLPLTFSVYSSTYLELIGAVLITLGLFTRLISVPLLVVAIIAQFYGFYANEHYFWMFVFSGLIIHGPGKISMDHFLWKKYECARNLK